MIDLEWADSFNGSGLKGFTGQRLGAKGFQFHGSTDLQREAWRKEVNEFRHSSAIGVSAMAWGLERSALRQEVLVQHTRHLEPSVSAVHR